MSEERWLSRVWRGKAPGLANELLARWPSGLSRDIKLDALANRLRDTDAGKSPPGWWASHDALIPILAEVIGQPEAEVRSWIERKARQAPGTWTPPGLLSVTGAKVSEPPSGLWSPLVTEWVEQLERAGGGPLHAWAVFEPGVAGEWMKEWFEHRGWSVVRAVSWAEASKKLRARGRTLVQLTGTRPPDVLPPAAPRGATVCVVASFSLRGAGSTGVASWSSATRWRQQEVPTVGGWALLDAPVRAEIEACSAWFIQHSRPDRRPSDAEIAAIQARMDASLTPGEALMWLDVASDDDPVDAFLARTADVSLETLLGIEREAARRGVGPKRTLGVWRDLVPGGRSAEDTLDDVKRSLARGNVSLAKKLVDGRARAVVDRLVEQRLLQPCVDEGEPADTWLIWPRWLGKELMSRAVGQLASTRDDVGSALLASAEGARAALAELERLVDNEDWDRVHQRLCGDPRHPVSLATTEGMGLALGLRVLDGRHIPAEVAAAAVGALAAARDAVHDGRILPHGDGAASPTAARMAAWALGLRTESPDPRFGPRAAGAMTEEHLNVLADIHQALNRWTRLMGGRGHDPGEISDEARTMAARVFRLGTLLFEAMGVLPVREASDDALWPFQVPAVLRAVSLGGTVLPGKTIGEVLRGQVPGVDVETLASRGDQLLANHDPAALHDTEATGRAVLAMLFRGLAAEAPEARTRKRAIEQVVTTASANFAFVRTEVEGRGGSFFDVARWLWARWNEVAYPDRDIPPVALLRDPDLEGAKALWAAAPATVHREIWRRASEESAFWNVLPSAGWRAWAGAGVDAPLGWARMPSEVLLSLLDGALPNSGYAAAWHRAPGAVIGWLAPRLSADLPRESSARRCLEAAPSVVIPTILGTAPRGGLPREWLQAVVTGRWDGWREAWARLQADSRP